MASDAETIKQLQTENEHLRGELAQYQQFFGTLFASVFVKDEQGRYQLISGRIAQALQRSYAEIIGKTDHDLFPAEVADVLKGNDTQVLSTGKPSVFDEVSSLPDGKHTYRTIKFPLVDADGNISGIGGMALDMTEYGS